MSSLTFSFQNKECLNVIKCFNNSVTIYKKGIIYNYTDDELIYLFEQFEFDFIVKLDGSFIIVIDDNRNDSKKIHVITDVINSLKFFYAKTSNEWEISDDIEYFDKNLFSLNIKGIACFLANGNMLNGITLFEDVLMSEGACIYTFENKGLTKKKYWEINFNYKDRYSTNEKNKLKQTLKEIILESIKINLNSAGKNILVSLSAGYDARSILGLIKKINSKLKVSTFTYRPTEKIIKDSDADISQKISDTYANKHYGLKSFHDDFISTLYLNAQEGKCLTNFCDELDAIKKLTQNAPQFNVFAGDEWFGRLNVPLNTDQELLDSVSIVGSWGIKWLKDILDKNKNEILIEELNKFTSSIIYSTKRFSNQHDKKDFLYLNQRVNHVNLTWREYFTSQIGTVHNPYLSRNILDFYREIPPQFRLEKVFFIEIITELIPEIFTFPIANERRSLSGINYEKEIIENEKALIEILETTSSYLEAFITKKEIIKAINKLTNERNSLHLSFYKKIKKIINASRRIYKPVDMVLHPILGPRTVKIPGSDKIVLRLLLLWIYLIKKK